jgi:hypothetical protein
MWDWLMDWLPDLRVGAFEIRDLLSLGMAALGAYLAWLAIKMGRAQKRLGEEQKAIAERQERLDIEQASIARRLAEITEVQHRLMMDQAARKPRVEVAFGGIEKMGTHNEFPLLALNLGDKPVPGFHFSVAVPQAPFIRVLEGIDGGEMVGKDYEYVEDFAERTRHFSGFCNEPLFSKGASVQFARVIVDYTTVPPDTDMLVDMRWSVVAENVNVQGLASDSYGTEALWSEFREHMGLHVMGSDKKLEQTIGWLSRLSERKR